MKRSWWARAPAGTPAGPLSVLARLEKRRSAPKRPGPRGLCRRRLLAALAGPCLLPTAVWAGEWKLLGERSVRLLGGYDEILVTGRRGTLRRILLKVLDQDVEFFDVTVHFANGESFSAHVRSLIRAGGRTRAIDLPGRDRIIRRVALTYRTRRGSDGRARVQLWGWS